MKKLTLIILFAASLGMLSTVEVRPLIGELVEGVLGTAHDVASDVVWGPYWWDNYWGPNYWDSYDYYPYLIERYPVETIEYPTKKIEISGDDWNITNKTKKEIIVGTYDGKIHGRIRPGETVRIPTEGNNRLIIGHKKSKATIFKAKPGNIVVTEKNEQEVQIQP